MMYLKQAYLGFTFILKFELELTFSFKTFNKTENKRTIFV